jgi:hypothetical protein
MPTLLFNKLLTVLSKNKTLDAQKILNDIQKISPSFYNSEIMKRPIAYFMMLQNQAFSAIEGMFNPDSKENIFFLAELARIKKNISS